MAPPYRYRVIYADTDMAGVVYHANYLRYFEAARTELLYQLGIDLAELHTQHNLVFAITEASLQYLQSARYGELLTVTVTPTKVGPARITLSYQVRRNDQAEPCVTGWTTFAALDASSGQVVRLPEPMKRAMLEAMGKPDHES